PNCPTCDGKSQRIFSVPHFNLSSGGAFLKARQTSEPKLEKREKEPSQPNYQSHKRDRPWMIGH
ncbi:MAG: zinc ribbon domain-containing protein, partial [Cyanobacteria bacterium]|nr:zinc ribbon domain-containing protein [Cyanobacteria bacterium GSL.Bin1]